MTAKETLLNSLHDDLREAKLASHIWFGVTWILLANDCLITACLSLFFTWCKVITMYKITKEINEVMK